MPWYQINEYRSRSNGNQRKELVSSMIFLLNRLWNGWLTQASYHSPYNHKDFNVTSSIQEYHRSSHLFGLLIGELLWEAKKIHLPVRIWQLRTTRMQNPQFDCTKSLKHFTTFRCKNVLPTPIWVKANLIKIKDLRWSELYIMEFRRQFFIWYIVDLVVVVYWGWPEVGLLVIHNLYRLLV